jgi:hypothetical protein
MTRGLQRTTFNRSGLVRILSETLPEAIDPHYDFGQRLGQWLDFTDALDLFSVLNAGQGAASVVHEKPAATGNPLSEQLARTRRNLTDAIHNDGVFGGAEPTKIRFPTPLPQAMPESAADFSPYHRYYLAHQRDMSAAIAALRANARKALAKHSPAHRQLAELDLAFEKSLAARERNLLATIPMHLAKRFAQRYADHRSSLPDDTPDDPATWTTPGSWLEAFCHDAQAVLLAELDLRLKPVAGLIAALCEADPTR